MKLKNITVEQIFYLLILILALGIRVLHIDQVPLSEDEAGKALQALAVARGETPSFSTGPAFPLLTGLTFFLFEDTNAYARIWPIIAGCCLVIFPYLIRSFIGRKAALIMALGLAISPTMVLFSRTADPRIMAVSFAMMAIGFSILRKPILAGMFLGLMLLCGPTALSGLIGLGITWLVGNLLSKMKVIEPISTITPIVINRWAIVSALFSSFVVILIVGTLFFRFPSGIGAFAEILPSYIQGWIIPSDTSLAKLFLSLILYNPVVFIFGILAIIQAWRTKDTLSQWLSIWTGISLLIVILQPGREVFSWVWLLIPMWALASTEIARYFKLDGAEFLPSIGQALLIFLLMALGWLNLAGVGSIGGVLEANQLRWAIIGGTIVLGGVTTLLIGLGWSFKTAQQGLVWGLLLGFIFYGVSLMWGVSQLRPNGVQELIGSSTVTTYSNDFQETLGDLSEWRTGMRDTLDVVLTTTSPSLRWEMRNWSAARFMPSIPVGDLPSVIINEEDQPSPNLAIGYRGQDFPWWQTPGWEGVLPENWPRWLVFREAPMNPSNIILWARGDLFPGGVLGEAGDSGTVDEENIAPSSLPVD
jgi:hypothetical protein